MISSKKKVLFIGPIPPPFSGPELSMHEFLNSKLLNEVLNIDFIQTNFRKSNKSKGKFGFLMVLNFFMFFSRLIYQFLISKPDLVYYPVTPTQKGWLGRDVWTILLAKVFKSRVLIHLRGSHFRLNYANFNALTRKLVHFSIKKVDGAIVQANYLKEEFSPFIDDSRIFILYQSIDTGYFNLKSYQDVKPMSILCMGHLTKAKGYTDILKIIPDVAEVYSNVEFLFAGEMRRGERGVFYNQFTKERIEYEDPYLAEERLIKTAFRRNYKHLGLISDNVKLKYLQTADIFLSASYSEGFSRSMLEAMSVGTPIVFTPVGAHREVFDNAHGRVFLPGDTQGMANAIISILKDEKRIMVGKHNRSYVKSRFDVVMICQEFLRIVNITLNEESN